MRLARSSLALIVVAVAWVGWPTHRAEVGLSGGARSRPRLAIVAESSARASLLRLDPRTLRPVGRRRLGLGVYAGFPTLSPDGKRLALADTYGRGSIRLVDTCKLRFVWRAELRAPLSALAWLAHDRLVALAGDAERGDLGVVTIDAVRHRVVHAGRVPAPAAVWQGAASPRHLVVLLWREADDGELPPTELLIVDADGGSRRIVLQQVRTGWLEEGGVERRSEPGLVVDLRAERAVVVAAGAPVAEIELNTGAVAYHELSRPVSLLTHLHRWLEPAADAKGPVAGPVRSATWLPNGLIAVTGTDREVTQRPDGTAEEHILPAGLQLVDPRGWSVRTVNAGTSDLAVGTGTLIAWTLPMASVDRKLRAVGLTAYTLDGEQRFQRFAGRPIMDLDAAGRYAYVWAAPKRVGRVLDLESGTLGSRFALTVWPRLLDEPQTTVAWRGS